MGAAGRGQPGEAGQKCDARHAVFGHAGLDAGEHGEIGIEKLQGVLSEFMRRAAAAEFDERIGKRFARSDHIDPGLFQRVHREILSGRAAHQRNNRLSASHRMALRITMTETTTTMHSMAAVASAAHPALAKSGARKKIPACVRAVRIQNAAAKLTPAAMAACTVRVFRS